MKSQKCKAENLVVKPTVMSKPLHMNRGLQLIMVSAVVVALAIVASGGAVLAGSTASPSEPQAKASPIVITSFTYNANMWWPNLETFHPIVNDSSHVVASAIIMCSVTTTTGTYYGGTYVGFPNLAYGGLGWDWAGGAYVEVPDGSVIVSANCILIPMPKNPAPVGASAVHSMHLKVLDFSYGPASEDIFEEFSVTSSSNGKAVESAIVMCSITTQDNLNTYYGGANITLNPGQTSTLPYYVTIPTSNVNPIVSGQCVLISIAGLAAY